jgi:hypothetical protein
MKRWKLYFSTDHLPPHLRAISEPFGVLAAAIVESGHAYLPAHRDARDACLVSLPHAVDREQAVACYEFMDLIVDDACDSLDPVDAALGYLLAAKDCAVRAHLPEPVTP